MSDNIDIIVQDTINDIIVNSSTIVETIDIVVEASVEEVTIISNPNDYIININKVIGEQVQSDWNVTIPQDPAYIKNKPTIPDAQVNSDWNATTGVAEILNKPTIPTQVTNTSELINDGADGVNPFITAQDIPAGQVNSDWNATSGVAEILNKPTIPAEQVNSDWNATSGKAQILNKPTIPSISGLATITYVDTQDALKVDKIAGKGLSTNDFTNTLKTKLDGIQDGAEVNVNADWNAVSGDAQILNKPTIPSIAGLATITYVDTQDALKVDKVAGKGLSTNDFTNTLKTKLDGIQDGAEVNVNADWNATSGDAQILNKPTIPAAQVNSDWNATSGVAQILNKPTIPTPVTNTSDLINDGADGVNPFITALDIPVGGQASTLVREVKNMTGATLTKGTIVYISGANGNKILVSKAQATSESLSSRTFGLLQSNILNNGVGYCVIVGDLSGLDTSSFTEGAQLYLSPTTAGAYTTTKPSAPDYLVYIGKITRSHPTQGQIEVQIQNGYELQELHNVAINGVANNQLLSYESSTSLWKNKSVTTADIADSTDKRYVTDANLTTIGNQSGTNTGDNAVNSLYSGLATSKQDTLVSGTNIKTINGNDILGSGDLTISGGGATGGVHAQKFIVSGQYINQYVVYSGTPTTSTVVANRLYCIPFFPNQTFTTQSLTINVTLLSIGGLAKVLIFSDLNGVPSSKLYESADFDCSTTGNKTASVTFTFTAGTTYWLGFIANNATNVFTHLQQSSVYAFSTSQPFSAATGGFIASTYNSIPSTLGTINYQSGNIPMVSIRKA